MVNISIFVRKEICFQEGNEISHHVRELILSHWFYKAIHFISAYLLVINKIYVDDLKEELMFPNKDGPQCPYKFCLCLLNENCSNAHNEMVSMSIIKVVSNPRLYSLN